MITYETAGTCATSISFEVLEGKLRNVSFKRGCNGNLQALSILVEGMEVQEVVRRLGGIDCGGRGTSCADQLARALLGAAAENRPENA